jgi:hypothetical protein
MTGNKSMESKDGKKAGADERSGTESEGEFDPQAPSVDPTAQPREQVPVMVDPERPYVDGQSDPYAEQRDPATGQIPAEPADK